MPGKQTPLTPPPPGDHVISHVSDGGYYEQPRRPSGNIGKFGFCSPVDNASMRLRERIETIHCALPPLQSAVLCSVFSLILKTASQHPDRNDNRLNQLSIETWRWFQNVTRGSSEKRPKKRSEKRSGLLPMIFLSQARFSVSPT